MARQAVGLRELARRAHYSPGYLSRVLSGQQPPSQALRRALSDALGLTDDDARLAYVLANPQRLDAESVGMLAASLAAQRRADDTVGPGPLVGPAEEFRKSLLAALPRARGAHRDALCAVVSEASQFAGWLHIELGDHGRAGARLNEAIDLADDIEDESLVAQAYNLKGNIARQRGRWSAVHRNFAAAYAGCSPLRQRVVNGAQAASALAAMGKRSDAEKLLGDVEALRDRAASQAPPSTAYWLTEEWMSLPIGHVHLNLGRRRHAAEHLRAGLDSLPPEHRFALWTRDAREALAEAEAG